MYDHGQRLDLYNPDLCVQAPNSTPISTYVRACVYDGGETLEWIEAIARGVLLKMPFPPNHRSSQQLLKTSTLKRDEEKNKKKGRAREEKGVSRGEKSEVPVVAAVVLVCLPADKPQGSHGTFEARTREEE